MERADYIRALQTEHRAVTESPVLTDERKKARHAAIADELANFGIDHEGKPAATPRRVGQRAEVG